MSEDSERHESSGTQTWQGCLIHRCSLSLYDEELSLKATPGLRDLRGAKLAGSSQPFLGRERAAVSVDVDPERRSPR